MEGKHRRILWVSGSPHSMLSITGRLYELWDRAALWEIGTQNKEQVQANPFSCMSPLSFTTSMNNLHEHPSCCDNTFCQRVWSDYLCTDPREALHPGENLEGIDKAYVTSTQNPKCPFQFRYHVSFLQA